MSLVGRRSEFFAAYRLGIAVLWWRWQLSRLEIRNWVFWDLAFVLKRERGNKMNEIGNGGLSNVEMEHIRRHHRHEPGENQCGSALVKHIRAPVPQVFFLMFFNISNYLWNICVLFWLSRALDVCCEDFFLFMYTSMWSCGIFVTLIGILEHLCVSFFSKLFQRCCRFEFDLRGIVYCFVYFEG